MVPEFWKSVQNQKSCSISKLKIKGNFDTKKKKKIWRKSVPFQQAHFLQEADSSQKTIHALWKEKKWTPRWSIILDIRASLNHSPTRQWRVCSRIWRVKIAYLLASVASNIYISMFYMRYNNQYELNIVILHINGKQIKLSFQWFYLRLVLLQLRTLKSKT